MLVLNDLSAPLEGGLLRCSTMGIAPGECVALVGKSGAGKTTFIEAICGIKSVVSGEILLDGVNVNSLPAEYRSIGLVPQDTVLFPGLNVSQQIEFGMKMAGHSKVERVKCVQELTTFFEVEHLLLHDSEKLSGGEAKCVAILRALASQPKLLCLDECFNGLDQQLKISMMAKLKGWIKREGVPALFIAHQEDEVELMADHVYQLHAGVVEKLT